jgi:nitrite reductase/ring-hydroxylating ferredoxin subunit
MNDLVFRPVVALDELKEGRMHACQIEDREIVLCRTREGVYALDNVCTHAYARMNEGRLRGTRLICPLHGASFDVRDGRVLGAPATQPLVSHLVRVVDGMIEVAVAPGAPKPMGPY